MKLVRWVVLAPVLLAGCAVGVNFTKPANDQLVVGVTTESAVLAQLGKPNVKGTKVVNGQSLNVDTYAYAVAGSDKGALPGVTPARALSLMFKDGVLVEKSYASSFKSDSTMFDTDKAKSVHQGMPLTEVEAMLGKPSGDAIYPVASTPDVREVIYSFSETKGFKSRHEQLAVEVGKTGLVTKADYTEFGRL